MNAFDLLSEWPSWKKANAETVLASPAWRLVAEYNGGQAVITKATDSKDCLGAPRLSLDITMDDVPNVLSISLSEVFPDLCLLSDRLDRLPEEVLIALVEKECGSFLQTVEDAVQQHIKLIGGSFKPPAEDARGFVLATPDADIGFSLTLTPALVQTFGVLKNLDLTHESIRGMEREAAAEYAVFNLLESEIGELKKGDRLVFEDDAPVFWRTDPPMDDLVHVRGIGKSMISFAQFADDDLPEPPEPKDFELILRGTVLRTGRLSPLGCCRTVEIL